MIHGFWLEKLGIDAEYRATHVTPEDLPKFIDDRRADPAWRGCNVTIPHKVAMLDLVDDPGGVRDSIGAMNTVVRDEKGRVFGTNTDAAGFYAPIADLDLAGAPVAIVGAGGAARAILFALATMDVGKVTILNRSPLKAAALLGRFGLKGEALPLTARLPAAKLLVNTSALGMEGQPPLDLDLLPLPPEAIVYDIVYAPLHTPLLDAAEARGLDTIDGLEMLVGQAAAAFELFFGQPAPREHDGELREKLLV
ncbi:shikimate dehydrogenase family protein [Sphingomonas radiodurans]|uniref:shikimate dehydrogenase family protein n=1 Tax=Sphingomonas radiodurans TaxID=2890321 RepID=UPI001E41441C|nr:shikimate dehydrogenase [Sphingomonas radiodurans]WBH18275.1 shikimate dehydrogenase [Sphingomonas radiodurans]